MTAVLTGPSAADPLLDGPLLSCRGVEVAYDGVQVLFGVDMDVEAGEIVALLGTNGAGKSTLLRAISGLVEPSGGRITFGGTDITKLGPVPKVKLGIIQVPGGKSIFPTLTVAEHFRLARWQREEAGKEGDAEMKLASVLQVFPRLRERWNQMGGSLSGGEAQQLGLGMAFVCQPRLLVIDELSLGLAPTVVEDLLKMVQRIHDEGATVILVEQSVNVALELAERAYFMEKGEVRFSGRTAELLERDDILRAVFLEGASSLRQPTSEPTTDEVPVVRGDTSSGALLPAVPEKEAPEAARSVVLSVENLSKAFGTVKAVNGMGFELGKGEILGLIGPNGAGKTTVFDLLSGLVAADRGTIRLRGVDISSWSAPRRAALGLGRSFQDARLFPSLTVAENIAIGLDRHLETKDHLSAVLCLPAIQESEADVDFTVEQLIELFSLEAFREKFVSELSTGSRRIVDLAMAIAHNPTVLILDEPSSGIAQREAEALGPLMQRIRAETGCSMLVIEHDMELITAASDRMLALDAGRVIAEGPPRAVIADPHVVASYLGTNRAVITRSGRRRDDDTVRLPVTTDLTRESAVASEEMSHERDSS